MAKYSFPQSVRKYIRLCKADIRRQLLDAAEQEKLITKLYEDMAQKYQVKGVPQEPVGLKKEK